MSMVWVGPKEAASHEPIRYRDHCQLHFSPPVWGVPHLLPHLLPRNLLLPAQEGVFKKRTCVQHVSFLPNHI